MFEIVLHNQDFGGNAIQTISARDLWQGLGIKRQFQNWFDDQINARALVENIDYAVSNDQVKNPLGGRPRTEYFLTIRAAKHIAAMSRSEGGEDYRNALFNLEEQVSSQHHLIERTTEKLIADRLIMWKALEEFYQTPRHIVLIEASKDLKKLGVDTTPLLNASPLMDNISEDEMMLEPTELAKRLDFNSAQSLNKTLRDMGLQNKVNGEWIPTDAGAAICSRHSWQNERNGKSGYNLKWNINKVRERLRAYTETD